MKYPALIFGLLLGLTFTPTQSEATRILSNKAPDAIDLDETATSADFDFGTFSGYLKFRTTYQAEQDQDLVVRINAKVPLRLFCIDVHDFRFALTDAKGSNYRNSTVLSGGGIAIYPRRISSRAGPCSFGPAPTSLYSLPIDELYPNLRPGEYKLVVTFVPRDGSVPQTELPAIHFHVL